MLIPYSTKREAQSKENNEGEERAVTWPRFYFIILCTAAKQPPPPPPYQAILRHMPWAWVCLGLATPLREGEI